MNLEVEGDLRPFGPTFCPRKSPRGPRLPPAVAQHLPSPRSHARHLAGRTNHLRACHGLERLLNSSVLGLLLKVIRSLEWAAVATESCYVETSHPSRGFCRVRGFRGSCTPVVTTSLICNREACRQGHLGPRLWSSQETFILFGPGMYCSVPGQHGPESDTRTYGLSILNVDCS